MRYLVQFLVPALIVLVVVYLLAKTKRGQDEAAEGTGERSDTGTFILILVVGATVAVLSFFLMQGFFA
ncbi:MAG: hypothetical protein EP301_08495 [Gammaproteobacteria bacterium]|jgi:hypothetical protein|nr:MAG: hypothetical protein EP301_08495 [Gammaproteobacteria bacterium]